MGDLALSRRLLSQARFSWKTIALLVLVGLLASPLALLTPLPLKIAVDSVLGSRPVPPVLDGLLPIGAWRTPSALMAVVAALAIVIALATQLQSAAQKYLTALAGERLQLDFRARLFRHLERLSLTYHDTIGTSDSLYRIQQDAPAIRFIIIDGFIPLLSSAATIAGMIYVTWRLDWQLALVALVVGPPLLLVARAFRPRLRGFSREVRRLESVAMGVVHEVLGALRVVKVFGQEEREANRFVRRSRDGMRGRVSLALAEGRLDISLGLLIGLGTTLVLFLGVSHVQTGALSLGSLLLVMGYLGKLYDPIKTIGRKVGTLQGHLASAERVFRILDEPSDAADRPDARRMTRARGDIAFENVSFAYAPDRPVLHQVSFTISAGASVGIAGTTGAGKSTLISLLTRLYDPTEGRILLDGEDLREYARDDVRRQFAVVLQDTMLFSASVAENIAYALPNASREQIIAAAEAANAHEFIIQLPRGYDTEVGDRGLQLSGGQRQRIALARAFLKDSPILILDEPTSGVDTQTEAAIVGALARLREGRTVITISHRPSAVARCTVLLTVEHGRIVADSTRVPQVLRGAATPASRGSARRKELMLAHPAVQAWSRLNPERVIPDHITAAELKANKARLNLSVYRLAGVGPGGADVIAKRCKAFYGQVERTVYERILPQVSLPGPQFYGSVPGGPGDPAGMCWLFMGEAVGEKYDAQRADHRAAAARWLGVVHTEARDAVEHIDVPDAGPARYRTQLHAMQDVIRGATDNPAFTVGDLDFLGGLLDQFDELDAHWDRLELACTGLPTTLIHGDFNGQNLRVQQTPDGPHIVVFDWEYAGRGIPCIDLAPTSRFAAAPDLATYWSVVRGRWPMCRQEDVERLATCGTVFRALASLEWQSHHLVHPWANAFLSTFQMYQAELGDALRRLGLARAARSAVLKGATERKW